MNDVLADAGTQENEKTLLGFWIYLMTDVVLFATLFATYIVLRGNTNGGPSGAEIFDMSSVLIETIILLTSSFTAGLMALAARRQDISQTLWWLLVTVLLGMAFLGMELSEFTKLASEGNGWSRSGFLSAFFTLVGTHGLHIFAGLLWAGVLFAQVVRKKLTNNVFRRLSLFGMFWHFLDIIWIFIFTIVYLMGVS
jgi:cytochrome o ubiquinol oxidase subunit 3